MSVTAIIELECSRGEGIALWYVLKICSQILLDQSGMGIPESKAFQNIYSRNMCMAHLESALSAFHLGAAVCPLFV